MYRVTFKCDHCKGPVWKDIESHKHVDLCCLYCGKRWFVPRAKWKILTEAMEKKYARIQKARKELVLAK